MEKHEFRSNLLELASNRILSLSLSRLRSTKGTRNVIIPLHGIGVSWNWCRFFSTGAPPPTTTPPTTDPRILPNLFLPLLPKPPPPPPPLDESRKIHPVDEVSIRRAVIGSVYLSMALPNTRATFAAESNPGGWMVIRSSSRGENSRERVNL